MKTIWKWTKLSALLLVFTILFTGAALAQGPEEESAQASGKQAVWVKLLAETLDMSVDELRDELKAGKTVEELAAEQGLTMSDIAKVLYDDAVERLDAAVAEGKLTQEKAEQIETRLAERRDACVNDGNCKLPQRRTQLKQQAERYLLQSLRLTAKSVDMNIFELLREFEAGNSLAEIALQQGESLEVIANALYNAGVEKVERGLSDGKLTQDQADKILARLTDRRDVCANEGQCLPLPKPADKK